MPSLIARRTAASSWGRTIPAIHALRIAQSCFAILSHVTFRALTNLLVVATTTISTFFITFGVWPCGKNTCNVYTLIYFPFMNPLESNRRGRYNHEIQVLTMYFLLKYTFDVKSKTVKT